MSAESDAVPDPNLDETVVVAREVNDETVVVAREVNDETVVVAREMNDETRAVRPRRAGRAEPSPSADIEGATVAVPWSGMRDPAPPVVEPDPSSKDLGRLLFKPRLDERYRAKESPFPQADHTLPQRGVRPGMPVVYGARSEALAYAGAETLVLERRVGAAPLATAAPAAQRDGLPSMARMNQRFRRLAFAGGAGVLAVVALGLWGIAALAFG